MFALVIGLWIAHIIIARLDRSLGGEPREVHHFALLIGYAIFQGVAKRSTDHLPWTLHESNINQTVASAAASIISGGLVAPIPAYTLLTGHQLDPLPMMAWVFSVSFLGIWIAWYLRPALLNDHGLKFPEGMATLETLQQIYNHGREAMARIKVLCSAALLSALVKWVDGFVWAIPRWAPTPALERLTFTVDPSLMLIGLLIPIVFAVLSRTIKGKLSCSHRSRVRVKQIKPRPCLAMKLMASGVT